jgi:hypothetical protein
MNASLDHIDSTNINWVRAFRSRNLTLATVNNVSGEDDANTPKVYYIRIMANGGTFWKLGKCSASVRQRFSSEPRTTIIDILKIWNYGTSEQARKAEDKLRKKLSGDLPYLGQCGPFKHGGNAETYSHDVLNGQPAPEHYWVKILTKKMFTFEVAYKQENPRARYEHLLGQVRYMDYLYGPIDAGEGHFFQVPYLSSSSHVVIASDEYLYAMLSRGGDVKKQIKKFDAEDALRRYIVVKNWRDDYPKMQFLGRGFSLRNAPLWSRGWGSFA